MVDLITRRLVVYVLEITEEWLAANPHFESGELVTNTALIESILSRLRDKMTATVQ